jgi:nitrite reductase/ring-hydroxylating ferredoxin subunit
VDGYRRVGSVEEFHEGKIRVFIADGGRVGVVRWHDRFFAFADACTHEGVTLRTGEITPADELVCAVHYAVFELATGRAIDGPRFIDDLPVYDVRVEAGDVYLGGQKQPEAAGTNGPDQAHG